MSSPVTIEYQVSNAALGTSNIDITSNVLYFSRAPYHESISYDCKYPTYSLMQDQQRDQQQDQQQQQ
jgi:hypothetical protein